MPMILQDVKKCKSLLKMVFSKNQRFVLQINERIQKTSLVLVERNVLLLIVIYLKFK